MHVTELETGLWANRVRRPPPRCRRIRSPMVPQTSRPSTGHVGDYRFQFTVTGPDLPRRATGSQTKRERIKRWTVRGRCTYAHVLHATPVTRVSRHDDRSIGSRRNRTHSLGTRARRHHVQRENVYAVGGVLHVGNDGAVPSARIRGLPGVRLATRLRHEPSKTRLGCQNVRPADGVGDMVRVHRAPKSRGHHSSAF